MPRKKLIQFIIILALILNLGISSLYIQGYPDVASGASEKENIPQLPSSYNLKFQVDTNATNDTLPARPLLSIKKSINRTEVQPGQWINVKINVTNVGNRTAYNLSVYEPDYEDWAVSTQNQTKQKYVIVNRNASFVYQYNIKILIEGNYTLEQTEITYHDINGTEYKSKSQRFNLLARYPENIELENKELWLNILYFSLGITGVLFFVFAIDLFAFQKWHKEVSLFGRQPKVEFKQKKSKQEKKKQIKRRKR